MFVVFHTYVHIYLAYIRTVCVFMCRWECPRKNRFG